MGKIAFLFAGQGAQYSGMGKSLYENSPAAKAVFDQCDNIRPGTSALCFEGSAEELSITVNTQPALFAMDLACAAAVADLGVKADFVAGFSLGELPALAFSGMLDTENAFRLVLKRAELMQACAEENKGGMIAVLRMENALLEEICATFPNAWPVNYNCPGQTVAACAIEDLDALSAAIAEKGGKTIRLPVSGAFHSPFMEKASAGLSDYLATHTLASPKTPLFSNVTADLYGENAAELIAKQVKSPVKWEETIRNLISLGTDTFLEVGAGKTLSGLVKKIDKEVTVINVESFETLQALSV